MPEMSLFGWFHTLVGGLALLAGGYSLAKFKVIRSQDVSGKIYLYCTVIVALSALGIYKHGGFGIAHALAVLTILAVLTGAAAEKMRLFGRGSPYIQAASYSSTFLFHMIPAITDGLMRLPVDAPVVTNLEDPLLRGFYLGFLITYVVGLGFQWRWLRRQ